MRPLSVELWVPSVERELTHRWPTSFRASGPRGNAGYGRVPLLRRKVERQVELDGCALWLVGGHRDASVELTEKTLDDLEAEACPRLVDIAILRKADSLIRDLDVKILTALFARDVDFAEPVRVCMFDSVGNKLVDEETEGYRLVR